MKYEYSSAVRRHSKCCIRNGSAKPLLCVLLESLPCSGRSFESVWKSKFERPGHLTHWLISTQVRVFLDERIISKISILGVNDDLTPLVDEVGADYLPSLFGGGYDLKCSSLLTDPRLIDEGAFRRFEEEIET